MYNRYIRNQQGVFAPIQEDSASFEAPASCGPTPPYQPQGTPEPDHDFLHRLLGKLGIGQLDTGDLLLLLILFLLFTETEGDQRDDELLFALGLLLIL